MSKGITVHILGDFGPFSRMGKSIGYQIEIGGYSYLIDCGAPLFQQIGGHGLKKIEGLVITHCHDDHKRWFSDLALFNRYAPDFRKRVSLLASEDVHRDIINASLPALGKSLSFDSRQVIDIPYEDYIDYRIIGPRAKYRIISTDEGIGRKKLCIRDNNDNPVSPDLAKIVINKKTGTARMLFRDPVYGEWVEPETFYTFSSEVFYEPDRNVFRHEAGFTVEALKAPVWHGITGVGIKISTGDETLIFSSDTAHNIDLWQQLCTEKREQKLGITMKEFESASFLYGDINDYTERTWSEERYNDAITAFEDAVVIHDISVRGSVVHTDYENLGMTSLKKDRTLLTHSPDQLTSEWALCKANKSYRIIDNAFFELAGNEVHPLNADLYHKEQGRYFAGYKNEQGRYAVYEKNGLLSFARADDIKNIPALYRVDLYEDISGRYFPRIEEPNKRYIERNDGRVELVEISEEGSRGIVVEDLRKKLSKPTVI